MGVLSIYMDVLWFGLSRAIFQSNQIIQNVNLVDYQIGEKLGNICFLFWYLVSN